MQDENRFTGMKAPPIKVAENRGESPCSPLEKEPRSGLTMTRRGSAIDDHSPLPPCIGQLIRDWPSSANNDHFTEGRKSHLCKTGTEGCKPGETLAALCQEIRSVAYSYFNASCRQ
jgi:hypothetical protein